MKIDIKEALNSALSAVPSGESAWLLTPWGEQLHPDHVLEEYPRPQMKRNSYLNLNGFWDYAITEEGDFPCSMDGTILVPFSPESLLSRVHRQLLPEEYLWYERDLPVHKPEDDMRCILHFGAVDQCAVVFVNGRKVFRHIGGYLPFEMDITDFLTTEENTLTLRVQDYSDTSYHSRGKQMLEPSGMFYTAQSGIWQSVWLEWVPRLYIQDVLLTCDYDRSTVTLDLKLSETTEEPVIIEIDDGSEAEPIQAETTAHRITIPLRFFRPWSPKDPYLYPVQVRIGTDEVSCYFALRCFTIENDEKNLPRICLNHKPIFLNGVLDQGYWSDGLYTAPSDEALIFDIKTMQQLGFNMIRKHAKLECARWYYHCDRLGMIVWQDMVNGGGAYHKFRMTIKPTISSWYRNNFNDHNYLILNRQNKAGRREWTQECFDTVSYLRHFPCISTWVPFNEGWGQFDADRITAMIRHLDPTRLVDSTSGWFEQHNSDFHSIHIYFGKLYYDPCHKPYAISEYGGYAYRVENHAAFDSMYGYKTILSANQFQKSFKELQQDLLPLKEQGLCAAVYTQLSDIESEMNGILTYDRRICKLDM
ncbi:MAG: glycoside hydrolase family 2 TIM barrel-domain containing protein [Lachnospiraceae bacterium]|nr:glycoside hydrolase family 2 TIM barrel-domain containing protein [Lachnospiraceae bacterium]